MLATAVVIFGLITNYGTAGGSDSYGYVSQADLWLSGSLDIPQPLSSQVPWPFSQWTLSPLGYRPSVDQHSIVPVYAPGLPLMMAAFKGVAGQCAIAWVIPLCGGLLVVATFGIGRRVFSDQVGAAGALLVATSPTLLFMLAQPMSDVPVAAFWALTAYGCLLDSRKGDLAAGLSASMAISIRPNLAHLGALMACWLLAREVAAGRFRSDPWRILIFGLPVAAAVGGVALLYRHLYGSATISGYGSLDQIYSLESGPENLFRYSRWLFQTQTPLALLGLIALFVPLSLIKPRSSARGRSLLALIGLGVLTGYLFWNVFDAWWYLRFLLTAWPALCLTSAWLLTESSGRTLTRVGVLVVVCVSGYGLWFSRKAGTFNPGEGDRRYAIVARLVHDATPPNSVVFTVQHSGSLRYYGSRMTVRYDWLNERWLDRAVAWLNEHGVHPYFLLDSGDVPDFQRRFAELNVLGRLNVAQVFEYRGGSTTYLYDALQAERPGQKPTLITNKDVKMPSCPAPGPPPTIVLKDQ